jgi:nucleoid DNA-binding protein
MGLMMVEQDESKVVLRKELVNEIASQTGIAKKRVDIIVGVLINTIIKFLYEGKEIKFIGLGNFSVQQLEERQARNPMTGEQVTVPPRKKLKFSFSKLLKDNIKKS